MDRGNIVRKLRADATFSSAIIRTKLPRICSYRPARLGFMCMTYDPQHEAEAAMKRAAASEGPDRQRLIELALAWHQLARDRRDDERRS